MGKQRITFIAKLYRVIAVGIALFAAAVTAFLLPAQHTNLQSPPGNSQEVARTSPQPEDHTQEDTRTVTFSPAVANQQVAPRILAPIAANKSPKQQSFRQSVDSEKPYYVMASSNDPLTSSDWKLDAVNATEAWQYTPENSAVVAVIDSGFALYHEDLINKWYKNPLENGSTQIGDTCWDGVAKAKSSNNCDDDENGYIDDWQGWDFYTIDNDPQTGTENSTGVGVTHGTEVAGLVGAETNNNKGTASVGYRNVIMPLQVTNDDGIAYTSDIMAAIYYAVDNGADVINISLGGPSPDSYLQQAVEYAKSHDVLIVAASGNCADSSDPFCQGVPVGGMTYPALYSSVIAVGAVNQSNTRASFSGYGPWLDIVAPGSGTLVSPTWTAANPNSKYASNLYGTSFSSPIVASIAGLLASQYSGLSASALESLLLANTVKLPAMNGQLYTESLGHGLVNAGTSAKVTAAMPPSIIDLPILQITGNVIAEHFYTPNTVSVQSCTAQIGLWCSSRYKNQAGQVRYLPYIQATEAGMPHWNFQNGMLSNHTWFIDAHVGPFTSPTYTLLHK